MPDEEPRTGPPRYFCPECWKLGLQKRFTSQGLGGHYDRGHKLEYPGLAAVQAEIVAMGIDEDADETLPDAPPTGGSKASSPQKAAQKQDQTGVIAAGVVVVEEKVKGAGYRVQQGVGGASRYLTQTKSFAFESVFLGYAMEVARDLWDWDAEALADTGVFLDNFIYNVLLDQGIIVERIVSVDSDAELALIDAKVQQQVAIITEDNEQRFSAAVKEVKERLTQEMHETMKEVLGSGIGTGPTQPSEAEADELEPEGESGG